MKLEDDDLKSLIRSAKSPGLSQNFLSSTLDKAGFSPTPLAAVHTTSNGHKLFPCLSFLRTGIPACF